MDQKITLKNFIQNTLGEICEGVEAARENHDYIAPKFFTDPNKIEKASIVEFDLAITATNSNTKRTEKNKRTTGGAKITVLQATLNMDNAERNSIESATSQVSRIKFSVPVFFRYDQEERNRRLEAMKKNHENKPTAYIEKHKD